MVDPPEALDRCSMSGDDRVLIAGVDMDLLNLDIWVLRLDLFARLGEAVFVDIAQC
jgi:hypothetical protein